MLIGVLSDTHGCVEATRAALRIFQELETEQLLHCGDIGSASIIDLFDSLPTHFVFGNVDNRLLLRQAIDEGGHTCHGRFGSLELAGKKIAFLHGDDGRLLSDTVASGQWDLVCHGHTHHAARVTVGSTVVLNPGALVRSDSPSVALVDLPAIRISPITL